MVQPVAQTQRSILATLALGVDFVTFWQEEAAQDIKVPEFGETGEFPGEVKIVPITALALFISGIDFLVLVRLATDLGPHSACPLALI